MLTRVRPHTRAAVGAGAGVEVAGSPAADAARGGFRVVARRVVPVVVVAAAFVILAVASRGLVGSGARSLVYLPSHRPPPTGSAASAAAPDAVNGFEGWAERQRPALGYHERPFVRKTVFRPTHYVFVAGLEGAGHHLYVALQQACPPETCAPPPAFSHTLWNLWCNGAGCETPMPEPGLSIREGNVESMQKARSAWAALIAKDAEDLSPRPRSVWLNLDGPYGTMSYPNLAGNLGEGKRLAQYPDLRTLAKMAERVEADFRVIVTLRRARAVLHSTSTLRAASAKWPWQATVLQMAADALLAQLEALDPHFYRCVSFEDVTDGHGRDGGGDAVAELVNWDGARNWLATGNQGSHRDVPDEKLSPGDWAAMNMLQHSLDQVASLCGWTRWRGADKPLRAWLPEHTEDS